MLLYDRDDQIIWSVLVLLIGAVGGVDLASEEDGV
jgi:hypothetical protein